MDSFFDNDLYNPKYQCKERLLGPTRYSGGGSPWTGHHHAKFELDVPEGVDPYELSEKISYGIGRSPAPSFFGLGSTLNEPTEIPRPCKTIFMPSLVSKVSSEDNSQHNVMVEAMEDHILSGKNGSSGINYGTVPRQREDGTWGVETEKESYGDSPGWTSLIRYFVGNYVLNRHIQSVMDDVHGSYVTPSQRD